ncbi:MAG: hypothetical protein MJ100_07140 [Ruminococcus sp.]|nr:hypothetical protein [Ruminococcus sp.]
MFLVNDLIALLAANLIFSQALGTSTLFAAAASRKDLVRTAVTITLFTTIGSLGAWGIDNILPRPMKNYVSLICYTVIVGILYAGFLTVLYFMGSAKFRKYKKYIHISAFNCAVMGTLFTVSGRAADLHRTRDVLCYLGGGIEAGIGFIIAALILAAAYRKLTSEKVPESFRGFPAMLIYLGIISMAVYALN